MKSVLPKILFYYSAIASFFIAISLTLTSNGVSPVVFAIFFLPVAGYFISEVFREFRTKGDIQFSPKKGETIAMFVIFLVLLGLGFKNISASKNIPSPSSTPSPSSEPLIFKAGQAQKSLSKLTISITDGASSVNIREKPTIYSKAVSQAKEGDSFEYNQKANGWYEVALPTGGTGYISLKYVKEVAE